MHQVMLKTGGHCEKNEFGCTSLSCVRRCKLQPLTCDPRWVAHLEDADSDEAANESGQAGEGATESTQRQGKGRARRRKEKSRRADEGEF